MQLNVAEGGLIRKQLIIEDHTLLVCPYCWTPEEIAKQYPELSRYQLSDHVCQCHFEILLTKAMAARRSVPRQITPTREVN